MKYIQEFYAHKSYFLKENVCKAVVRLLRKCRKSEDFTVSRLAHSDKMK